MYTQGRTNRAFSRLSQGELCGKTMVDVNSRSGSPLRNGRSAGPSSGSIRTNPKGWKTETRLRKLFPSTLSHWEACVRAAHPPLRFPYQEHHQPACLRRPHHLFSLIQAPPFLLISARFPHITSAQPRPSWHPSPLRSSYVRPLNLPRCPCHRSSAACSSSLLIIQTDLPGGVQSFWAVHPRLLPVCHQPPTTSLYPRSFVAKKLHPREPDRSHLITATLKT